MYIVKYSEQVHMARMRKVVHPRHMNSFRIFYDIHSITYTYKILLYKMLFVLLKHYESEFY